MEEPRIPEEPAPPQDSASIAAEDDGVEIMTKKPRVRRPPKPAGQKPATAVPGTSAFPTARVAKVIKSDKDVQMCSKEAIFLISVATEHFVKRFADAAYTRARLEQRKVIQYKDLAALCAPESRDIPGEYFYLEDVNPKPIATASTTEPRKSKPKPANIDLTTEDSAPVFDAVHEQDALASRSPAPPAQLATHSSSPETRRATRPGADGEIGDDDAVEGDVEMEADSMDVEE